MVIREAAKKLVNSETPMLDARVLLAYATKCENSALLFREPTDEEKSLYDELIRRRAEGEPVAYIIGEKEFMGLGFAVNSETLIPRPDTETVVEYLIEKYNGKAPKILDLCCGSGCIGISLGVFLEKSAVTLCDISEGALASARANAERHLPSERCDVAKFDVFKDDIKEKYDIIVSNPPYIASKTVDVLETAKYEPRLALDGGADGLEFYRAITPKAAAALNAGGVLAYEIGYDQKNAVEEILRKHNFENIISKKDYGGNFRLVSGEKL